MFDIIFYTDKNGNSDIVDYLDQLLEKTKTDKNAKVNREKILTYMAALAFKFWKDMIYNEENYNICGVYGR